MKLVSRGFTKASPESFFTLLSKVGVKKLFDVRVNNASQLAEFAAKDDLIDFAKTICKTDYQVVPSSISRRLGSFNACKVYRCGN